MELLLFAALILIGIPALIFVVARGANRLLRGRSGNG